MKIRSRRSGRFHWLCGNLCCRVCGFEAVRRKVSSGAYVDEGRGGSVMSGVFGFRPSAVPRMDNHESGCGSRFSLGTRQQVIHS